MYIKNLNTILSFVCIGSVLVCPSWSKANSHDSKESSHKEDARPCNLCHEATDKSRPAFVKFIAGASFSQKANIKADPSYWDPAIQGYNSRLGTAGIVGVGFGYEFYEWLAGDISLLHQSKFKYSKFQTPVPNLNTPNPLPEKTRHFDLESTSVMFNARLLGKGLGLSFDFNKKNYIAPFVGGGIGLTYHKVSNFFSSIAPTGQTTPFPGAASVGLSSVTTTSFSHQFEAGLQYKHDNTWGASVGYRWFDGGTFKGPNHIIAGTGAPNNPIVGAVVPPWKGRLRTHQVFAEISYNF